MVKIFLIMLICIFTVDPMDDAFTSIDPRAVASSAYPKNEGAQGTARYMYILLLSLHLLLFLYPVLTDLPIIAA